MKLAREGAQVVVNDLDAGPVEQNVAYMNDAIVMAQGCGCGD